MYSLSPTLYEVMPMLRHLWLTPSPEHSDYLSECFDCGIPFAQALEVWVKCQRRSVYMKYLSRIQSWY